MSLPQGLAPLMWRILFGKTWDVEGGMILVCGNAQVENYACKRLHRMVLQSHGPAPCVPDISLICRFWSQH